MYPYRVSFDELEWDSPMKGIRQKAVVRDGKRLRLVEYSRDMPPHWCEKGHYGMVLDGRFAIEFAGGEVEYGPGDGVFIPDGAGHRHRGRNLTDTVRVVFVEDE
ncbi:MAG: cupin domain-containing protein [Candidatus Krumholzibacteriota bacterium]|nr:cupin domain-containing protein [Candidatus Krumholzibacteriota bacterium]